MRARLEPQRRHPPRRSRYAELHGSPLTVASSVTTACRESCTLMPATCWDCIWVCAVPDQPRSGFDVATLGGTNAASAARAASGSPD